MQDDRILDEKEAARCLLNRCRNDVSVLTINNLYLESLRLGRLHGDETRHIIEQVGRNKADIAELNRYAGFLERFLNVKKPEDSGGSGKDGSKVPGAPNQQNP